jgi:transposase
LESTGRYHLLSAIYLSKASFDVRVINPLIALRTFEKGEAIS